MRGWSLCVCVSRRHTLAVDGRWFSCNFFTSLVWVPLPANLPLRQRIFKFCNGPANPHGAAGVRETNTTSLWVPLPNQQPDGSSAIWHLANMAPRPNDVEPPKAASKKNSQHHQATAQFSLCNRLQPPTLPHLTATSFRKGRNNRYHSVHARRSRAHQTSFLVPSTVLLVLSSALAGTARTGRCKKKREGASNMA